jgi:serine/threonine-protein kinase
MPLTPGTRVGPYTVGEVLGAGGMGEVHRATDTRLGREVALKVLLPGTASDPDRVQRFEKEARAAASLSHPNIMVVHDVGVHDGAPYLVTELLEGHTLRDELTGPLPTATALAYARQIVAALKAAHAKDIVHRDLKPENLFITSGGHLKLLDFGIARLTSRATTSGGGTEANTGTGTGAVLGTVGYMAPEQVRGQSVDPRADLFAFGCILYELLSGRRAFQGASSVETGYAVLSSEPPALPAGVPAVLDAVVRSCLKKNRDERMPSAEALEKALNGDAPVPVSRARYGRRALRALLGLVVLGAGTAAFMLRDRFLGGVPITAHPLPKTTPAAETAYRSALQSMRDGQMSLAFHLFERACELDPGLAAAHLRLALVPMAVTNPAERARHLAAAQQLRTTLDERDTAMLGLAAELVRDQNNPKNLELGRALAAQFPRDAEVAFVYADLTAFLSTTDDAALAQIDRTLELDPQFASMFSMRAQIDLNLDELDRALADADRCLNISPQSGGCLRMRLAVEGARGQCAAMEKDARRQAQTEPTNPRSNDWLAAALAANDAPLDSIRLVYDRMLELIPEGRTRDEARQLTEARLALLSGDFPAAQRALETVDTLRVDDTSEIAHGFLASALIQIAEETGDDTGALRIADAYRDRSAAWEPMYTPGRWRGAVVRHRLGKLSDAEFEAERTALRQQMAATFPPRWKANADFATWDELDARDVKGKAEAEALLARMPKEPPHPPEFNDLIVPALMHEAGHSAEALPRLKAWCSACTVMGQARTDPLEDTLWYMRGHLVLGAALEATGDMPGACAAYAVVMKRWKDAKPRSMSLEKAKERSEALHCTVTP